MRDELRSRGQDVELRRRQVLAQVKRARRDLQLREVAEAAHVGVCLLEIE